MDAAKALQFNNDYSIDKNRPPSGGFFMHEKTPNEGGCRSWFW